MTNETANQQDAVPGALPGDAAKAPPKTFAGCGAMMAEMMKKHGASESEVARDGETREPQQGSGRKEAGCGCGAMMERMMGRYFKSPASKPGEQR